MMQFFLTVRKWLSENVFLHVFALNRGPKTNCFCTAEEIPCWAFQYVLFNVQILPNTAYLTTIDVHIFNYYIYSIWFDMIWSNEEEVIGFFYLRSNLNDRI